jgi:substrate import-associated zinc metallohydrolase lipoprotein
MKLIKFSLIIVTASFFFVSCKKEDPLPPLEDISGLGGDTWVPTAIDNWIYDTLTVPYNISVKYKWDQTEIDLNKTLVPIKEEQAIPALDAINRVWIRTYVNEAGTLFFKNIAPKFFVLVGSPAYNSDGSIKLGTAEGGRKVVLYDMNNFRIKGMPGYNQATDTPGVIRVFQTIQHEFAHILDQNIRVPVAFSRSSVNAYSADWLNITDNEAREEGFITPYSQSSRDDDWAEMVSFLLVNGRDYFENYVNSINYTGTTLTGTTAAQARQRLRDKEAALVSYFEQAWHIDFYEMQAKSRAAINTLLY